MKFRTPARITRASRHAGLTLIELVVVLTILVALGGVLVPVVGNSLTRSHVATCAVNYPELTKILIQMEATRGDLGDGWTTGVFDSDGSPVNNSALNTDGGGGGAGILATGTLTADEVTALTDYGITTVWNHGDPTASDYDVTFNPGLTSEAITAATQVIVLTDSQAQDIYLQVGGSEKYIWLGIDKTWDALGDVTPEPPVHFGDAEGSLPTQSYSRFGAIFQVADADGDPMAEFKRVSYCIDGSAFETGDNHIGVHWQDVHGG